MKINGWKKNKGALVSRNIENGGKEAVKMGSKGESNTLHQTSRTVKKSGKESMQKEKKRKGSVSEQGEEGGIMEWKKLEGGKQKLTIVELQIQV